LILKDSHSPYYDFPGGRLDFEEYNLPLAASLEREVGEELGSEIKLEINHHPAAVERDCLWDRVLNTHHYRRVFGIFFEARYLGGDIKLSDEHEFYEWVDVKAFNPRGLFKPGYERAVRGYLRRVGNK
jgi:8-oxo-dGTP pyrophosphatase MutT (NUDIX family)